MGVKIPPEMLEELIGKDLSSGFRSRLIDLVNSDTPLPKNADKIIKTAKNRISPQEPKPIKAVSLGIMGLTSAGMMLPEEGETTEIPPVLLDKVKKIPVEFVGRQEYPGKPERAYDLVNEVLPNGKVSTVKFDPNRHEMISTVPRESDPDYMPKHNVTKPPAQVYQELKTSQQPSTVQEVVKVKGSGEGPVGPGAAGVLGTLSAAGTWLDEHWPRVNMPGTSLVEKGIEKLSEFNRQAVSNEEQNPLPKFSSRQLTGMPGAGGIMPGLVSMMSTLSPKQKGLMREDLARGIATPLKMASYTFMKEVYDKNFAEAPEKRFKDAMQVAFPDALIYPGTIAEQAQWMVGYATLFKGFNTLRANVLGKSWAALSKEGKAQQVLWEMTAIGFPFDKLTGQSTLGSLAFQVGVPYLMMGAVSKPVMGVVRQPFEKAFGLLWKGISLSAMKVLETIPVRGASGERNFLQLLGSPGDRLRKYTPEGQKAIVNLARDLHLADQQGRITGETLRVATDDPSFNQVLEKMVNTSPKDWAKTGLVIDALNPKERDALLEAYNVIDTNRKLAGLRATMTPKEIKEMTQTAWLARGNKVPRADQGPAVNWIRGSERGVKFLGFRPVEVAKDRPLGEELLMPVWGYTDAEGGRKVITLNDAQTRRDLDKGKLSPKVLLLDRIARDNNITLLDLLKPLAQYGNGLRIVDQIKRTYLNWDTYINNYDTYMARIFKNKWSDLPLNIRNQYIKYQGKVEALDKVNAVRMMAIDVSRYMKKNNLPQELVDALDPIVDMAALAHTQYVTTKAEMVKADAFRMMTANERLCMDDQAMERMIAQGRITDSRNVTINQGQGVSVTRLVDQNVHGPTTQQRWIEGEKGSKPQQFIKVPDNTTKYGMLAGKWLNQDAFFELETMVMPAMTDNGWAHKSLQWFKFGAVIANPRTHWRNIYSNVMLNHLAGDHGMSLYDYRTWQHYGKAVDILGNPQKYSDLRKKMAQEGITIGTFSSAELKHLEPILRMKHEEGLLGALEATRYGVKWVGRKMQRMYDLEEQWAKVAKYTYLTEVKGIADEEASRAAVESTFNYSDVSPFIQRWRNKWIGAPFITFTYKALPAITKGMVSAPWRMISLQAGLYGMQLAALKNLNVTQDEMDELQRKMPAMVGQGKYLLLPWRDSRGRLQWFDLTYILPWGDIYSFGGSAREEMGPRMMGVGKVFLANPLFSVAASIKNNLGNNGQPIWNNIMDSPVTAAGKALWSASQTMLPAVMTPAMDVYNSTMEAKRGHTPMQSLATNVFGLRVMPVVPQEIEKGYRATMYNEIKKARKEARRMVDKYGSTSSPVRNKQVRDQAKVELQEKIRLIRERMEKDKKGE